MSFEESLKTYKVAATVNWEIESNESSDEVLRHALEEIQKYLPEGFTSKIVRIIKPKHINRKVLGELAVNEVLPLIRRNNDRLEFKINDKSYFVRMNSQRYFVFRDNCKCVSCGIEGIKFLLEQHESDNYPHFNLYAEENGQLVLMTKDHIVPKSSGGRNILSNYQTMCSVCNNLKGNNDLPLYKLTELRKIYNENIGKIPKVELNAKLKLAKEYVAPIN